MSLDPGIVRVINKFNNLGFLTTLYSCAGFGKSSNTGKTHTNGDIPYVVIQYDDSARAKRFRQKLALLVDHAYFFPADEFHGDRFAYYLRALSDVEDYPMRRNKAILEGNQLRWKAIERFVSNFK